MIEFGEEQEKRAVQRDCRVWTKLMVEAWYSSDYPDATDYSPTALAQDLQEVYLTCHNNGLKNTDYMSLLGFLVIRAKMLNCSEADLDSIVGYFLIHARAENVDYAQNWIDLYLEGVA
jgi:hypothetical protein